MAASISSSSRAARRLDSAGEKTHRQLIDCIRSKDTDALIDAISRWLDFYQFLLGVNVFYIFLTSKSHSSG
jgi:DNA-binding FadR family transcriptional regulator